MLADARTMRDIRREVTESAAHVLSDLDDVSPDPAARLRETSAEGKSLQRGTDAATPSPVGKLSGSPDVTLCDRELIHIPASIQPHGLMLVIDPATLRVCSAAGDVEGWLGRDDWLSTPIGDLLGDSVAALAKTAISGASAQSLENISSAIGALDIRIHRAGEWGLIEIERTLGTPWASPYLARLEAAATAFDRTLDLRSLFAVAAIEFRSLTGYDRVMVYQFLEDDAGVVVGEDTAPGSHSFFNHHFPASDIPKQARALYLRNLVRVIPDVSYEPAPLRPHWRHENPLDMSDATLRSVSPVHLQYLKNMKVGASASFSIIKDGVLWGLVACHNETPLLIPAGVRIACRALAGALARQIKARQETDAYRERVRLRGFEDDLVSLLSREGSLHDAISNHTGELMKMLDADGVAVRRGSELVTGGHCPSSDEILKLAAWSAEVSTESVFATDQLGTHYQLEAEHQRLAAGVLAITLSAREAWAILWFRAEHLEVVQWAGNPHKDFEIGPVGELTPRASFDSWRETVHGRARRWTLPETEAASRLRTAVVAVWQSRRIHDLNRELMKTLDQKDQLLKQKEFLIGEVNHRVQNSLQLVSSFLSLQARASNEQALSGALEEARRRISAVSLVHRRLYRSDQLEAIDAGRYVDELLNDLVDSLGVEWKTLIVRDLQPLLMSTDRAISLGLVLTELVINANKYAYGGKAGRLRITLAEDRAGFRLTVADEGVGYKSGRKGFGTRMMDALVGQLGGTLAYEAGSPGTRAILTAPNHDARSP